MLKGAKIKIRHSVNVFLCAKSTFEKLPIYTDSKESFEGKKKRFFEVLLNAPGKLEVRN